MPHWKSMMDRDFIFAFDLNGKEVTVTIARVEAGSLTGSGGRKTKKPVVYFEGKEKGLALNATNCKTVAKLYGNYTEKWIGRQVTLYPTTTEMAGETVECIRVRPQMPKQAQRNGKGARHEPEPAQTATEQPELSADEAAEIVRSEAEEAAQS